eukprot:162748_1
MDDFMEYRKKCKNNGDFFCGICKKAYCGWNGFNNHLWRSDRYRSAAGGYYGRAHLANLLECITAQNDGGDEKKEDVAQDVMMDNETCKLSPVKKKRDQARFRKQSDRMK